MKKKKVKKKKYKNKKKKFKITKSSLKNRNKSKYSLKKRKYRKKKNRTKNRAKSKTKNKRKIKKIILPLDRIKKIKFKKLKIKKIKLYKPRINKKKLFKLQRQVTQNTKINLQKLINFILIPFFRAYDNYSEKKRFRVLAKIANEKKQNEINIKKEEALILENKKRELKEEEKLARERSYDLKNFIRQEQAILRKEQAKKRQRFLEEIKLEKKIESFRKRELQEIKNLEKLALREQRDDYSLIEDRLEKIKGKYRLIREQKIRERVQALGVAILDTDTKDDLLNKEKEYVKHRHSIELILESFYRSANSLVFQLNKRYIPKHKSILRVLDRRYESNECFIRYDDSPDDDWLVLIYLEDSDEKKGKIIVENKSNPEKHEIRTFEKKEIFTYSDYLVDSMTAHIDRERQKKSN